MANISSNTRCHRPELSQAVGEHESTRSNKRQHQLSIPRGRFRGCSFVRPGFWIEALLPFALIFRDLSDKRREDGEMQQEPIEHVRWKPQRLDKIDKQHHACVGGAIPRFVLVGIIENEHFPLIPVANLLPNADRHLL